MNPFISFKYGTAFLRYYSERDLYHTKVYFFFGTCLLAFSVNSRWRTIVIPKMINPQSQQLSCFIHVKNMLLIRISILHFKKHI